MVAAKLHRRRRLPRSWHTPGTDSRRSDVIPYDYGTTFRITGRPGNVIQSVINTAPYSLFVAVGISYGFEEDRSRLLRVPNVKADPVLLSDITLGQLPASALIEGFRVNPRFQSQAFPNGSIPSASVANGDYFQKIKAPSQITFLFSMLDSATGRELQDGPIHNIASLGKSDGQRPFRLFAQPIPFSPRTTVRLQIVERSQNVVGTLFVVLCGYHIVGSSACPELLTRRLTGPPSCPIETIGDPSARVIPFDYATTLELSGVPFNQLEEETTVNAEGGFVATSIGYGLLPAELDVPVQPLPNTEDIDLSNTSLDKFPPSALLDGIRVRPDLLRLAFDDVGNLRTLPRKVADTLFERLNRPMDVSFRYSIFDTGRGRDLQNQPLHNIAGLGSADGERPFKRFARSIIFQPRSTIRIRVEERFGRGTLFIVLQGYKLLNASDAGVRR